MEVPPELRGWSDEEIIQRSEKPLKEISGKRKNGAKRPSKRLRIALKEQRLKQELDQSAMNLFANAAKASQEHPKLSKEQELLIQNAFTRRSEGFSTYRPNLPVAEPKQKPAFTFSKPEPATPFSGRVLKASFGTKFGEKPKAVIMSADELRRQKNEEREKTLKKNTMASTVAKAAPLLNENGEPVKRPRGRPRKNPITV
ncbi:MAG: hypothetical protein HUK20_02935 [Fibrobacter sp.]|nr:hypothetical protein [Fibrobacter sp.]